jgi:hypothetical protein
MDPSTHVQPRFASGPCGPDSGVAALPQTLFPNFSLSTTHSLRSVLSVLSLVYGALF